MPLGNEYLNAGADASYLQALSTVFMQAQLYAYDIGMITLGIAGFMLNYTLHRAKLVPRSLAIWGLVGYAIIFFRMVSEVMGSGLGMVSSIPGGLWELFIGVWLIAKGFNPSAFASQSTNPDDVVLMGVQEPAVVPSNGHVTSKG
jgi:hypothetical protein